MTTSLVESCNHLVKHSSFSVHLNMNLDMTYAKILVEANTRIWQQRNEAECKMAKFDHASLGITKDVFITKGKCLVGREHDDRLKYCCVQLDAENFIVWNFENEYLGEMNQDWPWTELPRFHQVWKLVLHSHCGKYFITYSCGFRERVGIPCRHMLCVLDRAVEVSMMDVHWWKAFHKHYREESKIGEVNILCYINILWKSLIIFVTVGDSLYSAQQVCFDAEKLGCPISEVIVQSID